MNKRLQILLVLAIALIQLFATGCSNYVCNNTFSNNNCAAGGGGGGGKGGGGGGGGGGSVDASKAAALVYYDVSSVQAAGVTSAGSFGTLSSYTAPSLSSVGADEMTIVRGKFLYVPMGNSTIAGFSITRSTGALTPISGSPFTVPGATGTADGAWSDPQGRFLFVGSEISPDIWVFQINAQTGVLTAAPGSPVTLGFSSADIMTVDASGKFLYVGQGSPSGGIAAFSINQTTGALTALTALGSPFNLGVAQIHASPVSEFLLGVAEIQDGSSSATDQRIRVFSLDAQGVPTEIGGSPFLTSSAPFDFAISPNGKFVYTFGTVVTTSVTGRIEGFQMDTTTGALTSLGAPFSSLPTSAGCQFDQSGAYMFCVDSLFGTNLFVLGASTSTGGLTNVANLSVSSNFPYAVTD